MFSFIIYMLPRIPGMLKIEFNLGWILPAILPGGYYILTSHMLPANNGYIHAQINSSAIPAIPGILYILLYPDIYYVIIPAITIKWNFERHLLLGHSDTLAYENFSLKDDK